MSKLPLAKHLVNQQVDLSILPTPVSEDAFSAYTKAGGKCMLTLPDMHGNAFKVLYYLLWLGLIHFKETVDKQIVFSRLFKVH